MEKEELVEFPIPNGMNATSSNAKASIVSFRYHAGAFKIFQYGSPMMFSCGQLFDFCTTRNRRATRALHWKSRVSRSYPERSALSWKPHEVGTKGYERCQVFDFVQLSSHFGRRIIVYTVLNSASD